MMDSNAINTSQPMSDNDMINQGTVLNYQNQHWHTLGNSAIQQHPRYNFHEESHYYIDVLTKGGDICETNEDGTYVIVGDGSDDDDEESPE